MQLVETVMGATKTEVYKNDAIKIANIAKVLAHPARISILQYISKNEGCICNDIVIAIGLSQATVSQHLKVINDSGVLNAKFRGQTKCYCIDVESFDLMRGFLNSFFDRTRFNCC